MKKLLPAIILSFTFSFMLYIYEPIIMYAPNVNDFWFDLYIMLKPIIVAFLGLGTLLSLGFAGIYYLNKKFSKKINFYHLSLIMFLVVLICFYIQGNYLAGGLPGLEGDDIKWSKYHSEEIKSFIVWGVTILVTVIACIKFKIEKVVSASYFVCLMIFVMLMSSLVSTCSTYNIVKPKKGVIATMKNYHTASTDTNFLIFLVDAVDSVTFDKVMTSDKDFKDTFKDFTYFKDTTSVYGYTRDSVPQILGGEINENKTGFRSYSTHSLDNSLLFKELKNREYDINLYDDELIWESNKPLEISNMVKAGRDVDIKEFIKNQTKYVLFKYLPFNLKKYSKIENMYFNNSKVKEDIEYYNWSDWDNYDDITENPITTVENKYFHFMHIEGAHVPFGMSKTLEYNKKYGYNDKIAATLTIINAYLDRLKKYDVYDNSVIIIMSDHGYVVGGKKGAYGRQNPILFIKGVDEHHDMIRSKIPVSYTDLNSAYVDLLNGKDSTELFSDIDLNRERRYMWYKYTKENHMVEYVQKGKAWAEETLVPTGKEFNR